MQTYWHSVLTWQLENAIGTITATLNSAPWITACRNNRK